MNPNNYKGSIALIFTYLVLIFIPMEANFFLGPIRLEPYRLFLIVVTCYMFFNHSIYDSKDRVAICLGLYCFACLLSFVNAHGGAGIESSIILFMEVYVSYSLGKLVLGSMEDFKKIIAFFCIAFFVLAPFAILESQNGYRVLHVFFSKLFGTYTIDNLGMDYYRHGIHRASTVFSHPILYSIIAVMLLPFILLFNNKFKYAIGLFVAMITSVTSAGILMFLIQLFLLFCRKVESKFKHIFSSLVFIFSFFYLFLSFSSNRGPILVLIQTLALNPQTAYTRYLQWYYAFDDIARHPILGNGFHEWSRPFWMPLSIDSFWLMTVLQNGYLALLPLSLAFFISMKNYWVAWRLNGDIMYFLFFISLFSIVFAGFTVDFFDRAQLMVFFVMGLMNSFITKLKVSHDKELV